MPDVTMLYRPVGPKELAPIKESGCKAFPPRLPGQPIFYPVLNQAYATQIARDWNVRDSGAGYVTRFAVDAEFLHRYPVQKVGGAVHLELWVPAEELEEFNRHIVQAMPRRFNSAWTWGLKSITRIRSSIGWRPVPSGWRSHCATVFVIRDNCRSHNDLKTHFTRSVRSSSLWLNCPTGRAATALPCR